MRRAQEWKWWATWSPTVFAGWNGHACVCGACNLVRVATGVRNALGCCHGRTISYVVILTRTTIGTVSFPFYHLPFPCVLYYHVSGSMTRSLLCTSTSFYPADSYSYHDSTCFYVVLSCSFPRTHILGIPASGGASKPSSFV